MGRSRGWHSRCVQEKIGTAAVREYFESLNLDARASILDPVRTCLPLKPDSLTAWPDLLGVVMVFKRL